MLHLTPKQNDSVYNAWSAWAVVYTYSMICCWSIIVCYLFVFNFQKDLTCILVCVHMYNTLLFAFSNDKALCNYNIRLMLWRCWHIVYQYIFDVLYVSLMYCTGGTIYKWSISSCAGNRVLHSECIPKAHWWCWAFHLHWGFHKIVLKGIKIIAIKFHRTSSSFPLSHYRGGMVSYSMGNIFIFNMNTGTHYFV